MSKIKEHLAKEFYKVISELNYPVEEEDIFFEFTKNPKYGDIFTNIGCQIASKNNLKVGDTSEKIVKKLGKLKYVEKINAEKNGFINIFYSSEVFENHYAEIVKHKENILRKPNKNAWFFLEVISANPTGLLHIGHARNGIYSDTLGNLLEYGGYFVHREYLINDLGNQIRELVESIWVKYRSKLLNTYLEDSRKITKYNGAEIDECTDYIIEQYGGELLLEEDIFSSKKYKEIETNIVSYFLKEIEVDLKQYEISVNSWKSEKSFVNNDNINAVLKKIKNHISMKGGAVWFKCGNFIENQKDEVLIKRTGQHTYFCQDIIYHDYKLNLLNQSGKVINILGSDHYGHIDKINAFLKAIKAPEEKVIFICIQLVKLLENGMAVKISKRDSKIIHLRDLQQFMTYEEVRWFFVSQQANTPLEIELQQLKQKNYNNPVFYVMYAYSRISQLLNKYPRNSDYEKGIKFSTLKSEQEKELINIVLNYESVLESAVENLAPHKIPQYLLKLAQVFHSYYEKTNILNNKEADKQWMLERLALLNAIKYTIHSGLSIMKIKPKQII